MENQELLLAFLVSLVKWKKQEECLVGGGGGGVKQVPENFYEK